MLFPWRRVACFSFDEIKVALARLADAMERKERADVVDAVVELRLLIALTEYELRENGEHDEIARHLCRSLLARAQRLLGTVPPVNIRGLDRLEGRFRRYGRIS